MNTFGENIRITVFGEPYGPVVGAVLDGLPPGEEIDEQRVSDELNRRDPGTSELGPADEGRIEPAYSSGIYNGATTGAPLCALIRNAADSEAPANSPSKPRPGHPDLPAMIRYRGFCDLRGDGPFSWRLTSALVLAGAICRQILERRGITVAARVVQVGTSSGDGIDFAMKKEILDARSSGDSVGGVVECLAQGVPQGVGGLMFSGMESRISSVLFTIPGVKGVEFGGGFELASMRGSHTNDPLKMSFGEVTRESNNSGGVDSGLTTGMPLVLRCAFRPTPTIAREQRTVDLDRQENASIRVRGRADPCLAPRAVPVIESCVAACLLDAIAPGPAGLLEDE